jgi:hypothetical protein
MWTMLLLARVDTWAVARYILNCNCSCLYVVLICVLVIRIFFIILEEKGAPDTRWVGKYVVENNKEKKRCIL